MAIKKLKTAEITLIGCGDEVTLTATDTATDPQAKYALDSFMAEKQMKFKSGNDMYYVPFHAVDHIIVTETETEVADRPTPYGCYPDGTIVWYAVSGTLTPCDGGIGYRGTLTINASAEALVEMFSRGKIIKLHDAVEYTDITDISFEGAVLEQFSDTTFRTELSGALSNVVFTASDSTSEPKFTATCPY